MHDTEEAPLQSLFEICVLYCFYVINATKSRNLLFHINVLDTGAKNGDSER